MVNIQLFDGANWVTYEVVPNASVMINQAMSQLSSRFPNNRVRAVTSSGSLVDIL